MKTPGGAVAGASDRERPQEATRSFALACKGVSKALDRVAELLGVNVVTGENGAGKSTLFKVISGQSSPHGGVVKVRGEPVSTLATR